MLEPGIGFGVRVADNLLELIEKRRGREGIATFVVKEQTEAAVFDVVRAHSHPREELAKGVNPDVGDVDTSPIEDRMPTSWPKRLNEVGVRQQISSNVRTWSSESGTIFTKMIHSCS